MPGCCVQVKKANTGFKNCAKEKGDSTALAEARRVQSQLIQRTTQIGDVLHPKDSDSTLYDTESSLVHHVCSLMLQGDCFGAACKIRKVKP